eukprot:2487030-Pleurochrysis_carterae.AAC.1
MHRTPLAAAGTERASAIAAASGAHASICSSNSGAERERRQDGDIVRASRLPDPPEENNTINLQIAFSAWGS